DALIAGYLHEMQNIMEATSGAAEPRLDVKMADDTRGTVTWQPPAPAPPPTAEQGPTPPAPQPRPPAAPRPQSLTLVLVDGRWVPEPMAQEWDAQIEAAKAKIAALPESTESYRAQLGAQVQGLDQFLAPLEQAETRDAFHTQMNQLTQMAAMA